MRPCLWLLALSHTHTHTSSIQRTPHQHLFIESSHPHLSPSLHSSLVGRHLWCDDLIVLPRATKRETETGRECRKWEMDSNEMTVCHLLLLIHFLSFCFTFIISTASRISSLLSSMKQTCSTTSVTHWLSCSFTRCFCRPCMSSFHLSGLNRKNKSIRMCVLSLQVSYSIHRVQIHKSPISSQVDRAPQCLQASRS